MYKFGNLPEELEVLENQSEKAKQIYFGIDLRGEFRNFVHTLFEANPTVRAIIFPVDSIS